MKKSYLQAAIRIFRICMKLSNEEDKEMRRIIDERDETGFEFFIKHHWKVIL